MRARLRVSNGEMEYQISKDNPSDCLGGNCSPCFHSFIRRRELSIGWKTIWGLQGTAGWPHATSHIGKVSGCICETNPTVKSYYSKIQNMFYSTVDLFVKNMKVHDLDPCIYFHQTELEDNYIVLIGSMWKCESKKLPRWLDENTMFRLPRVDRETHRATISWLARNGKRFLIKGKTSIWNPDYLIQRPLLYARKRWDWLIFDFALCHRFFIEHEPSITVALHQNPQTSKRHPSVCDI